MRGKILFAYLLFLLYANLTPQVPTVPISGGDKIAHFLEFLILGILGYDKTFLFALPIVLEYLQLFVPGRCFSYYDMVANLIGFGVGVIVWWWYESGKKGASLFHKGRN